MTTMGAARKTIRMQAYSFTSAPIAAALKNAYSRGVDVRVILDRSQRTEHYSGMTFLVHAGIPVWIDAAHTIAHNKVTHFNKAGRSHGGALLDCCLDATSPSRWTRRRAVS